MIPEFPYHLYLVISEESCTYHSVLHVAQQAIRGGVDIIQLREKKLAVPEFTQRALALKKITDAYNIPLVINDNLEVAKAIDAFGIHVGNNDQSPSEIQGDWNKEKCIGYSIEKLEQLQNEHIDKSSYLGISPVYNTPTKTDTITQWKADGVAKIRQITDKPLVAIGRMDAQNSRMIIKAGADCIAVVSAICAARDPRRAAKEMKTSILNAKN